MPLELARNESSEHEPSLTAEKVFRKKDFNSAEKIEKVRVKERERERESNREREKLKERESNREREKLKYI